MANQEKGAVIPEQEQGEFKPELDEPRRTTEHQVETETDKKGYFPTSTTEEGTGFGGVSEQEPPHHKIHSDDEPLPKPKPGTYDADQAEEPREEQVMPSAPSDDVTAPKSTEQYQDFRSESEPKAPLDETPASEPRSFGDDKNEGVSDPSTAFAGAPVDKKVEEPSYGQDLKSSEPLSTDEASPSPKKEGLMAKIKEKLPGHHHKTSSSPETVEDPESPVDAGASPKKGLMAKIKEKLPGHHATPIATQ